MATEFARKRARLDTDAAVRWLDEMGVPLLLVGAVVTMVATVAGLAQRLA